MQDIWNAASVPLLTIAWFLVYWVLGGVLFMVISLTRPGKMKRVRFSCLYTVVAFLSGYVATAVGVYLTSVFRSTPAATGVDVAGLHLGAILAGGVAGFVLDVVVGWIVMLLTRRHEQSWYEREARR